MTTLVVEALALAKIYQKEWPLLIVCPSSLRLTWEAEISKWLGIHDVNVVTTGSSGSSIEGRVSVISYDLMTRMAAVSFFYLMKR